MGSVVTKIGRYNSGHCRIDSCNRHCMDEKKDVYASSFYVRENVTAG